MPTNVIFKCHSCNKEYHQPETVKEMGHYCDEKNRRKWNLLKKKEHN